jgi:hypothetical protein
MNIEEVYNIVQGGYLMDPRKKERNKRTVVDRCNWFI